MKNNDWLEKYLLERVKPETRSLWGHKITFKPVVCEKRLGDGLQIIGISSIDTRPLCWYVCIDSKTDIDTYNNGGFDYNEILEMIEDEFGRWGNGHDVEEGEEDLSPEEHYPAICWGGGTWWVDANFGNNKDEYAKDFIRTGIIF